MSKWYEIKADMHAGMDDDEKKKAEVLIYGDIGESWWGESVTAIDLVRELQLIDADIIDVRINSYGGSVTDGIAIYNALRRHPAVINTYNDGIAASIASLILMAGDTSHMAENALFMIHAPWGGMAGNSKEMREYADVLDSYAQAMASSYAQKTGKTVDEIMPLLLDGADHWLTVDEAIADGYVDESTDAIAVAASFNLSRYQNLPAAAAAFIKSNEEIVMPGKLNKPAAQKPADNNAEATPTAASDSVVDTNQVRNETHVEISARNKSIRANFSPFVNQDGVQALLDDVIDDTTITVEAAGQKLLAKLGKDVQPLTPQGAGRATVIEDARDKTIAGMTSAVLARVGKEKADGSNEFRGMSLSEMAGSSCAAMGIDVRGLNALERAEKALSRGIVRGAQTTSDFPVILENIMHKLVLTGFNGTAAKWQRFCKTGDVTDFRAWQRIVPGLIGNLGSVNENGEYADKVIPDGEKNSVTASRKGNIINITPEIIVNDDTGYINDMAMGLGAAGQRTIDRAVFALLASNPTMSDGKTLFHADHGNYLASGSGTAPSVTSLDVARVAMAGQTAPGDDAEPLDIVPAVAVCPTALGGDMRVINDAQYDPDTANKLQKPNKVRGLVGDIVDTPRLSVATAWYLFGDPAMAPVIEVVFLNGQREPRVVEEENFRTSGMAMKVELPFGVGAIDYRGGYYNYGS